MPYSFGAYRFDPARYELAHAGMPVPLRPKGCELLAYLLTHRDRVVSKEELLTQLWPGQYVGDAVLHACVLAVRKALHDAGRTPSLLHTIRGRGYRFVAPVEEQAQAPHTAPQLGERSPAGMPGQDAKCPLPTSAADMACASTPHAHEEYKLVTALCCGLADAPALAARLGPEGLYHLLQTVVGLTREVLQHYDGTLMPPTSEGVTAVFGAPVAQEDHARRAVLAALELRQRLRDHPILRAQLPGGALAVRMGLHAGCVVVGGLGQGPQQLATVVGEPCHLALRLQQQAAHGTILLSAATAALVHAEVEIAPCEPLTVDGQPTPVPVYAVQGIMGRYAGVAGRGRRARSPFVRRQRELALLHDRWEVVRTGAGQVVSLVGPPGMGKTRLLTEFGCRLAPDQVPWYRGQCLAYGQAIPYLPVRDVVQQVCALADGDPLETCMATVGRRLAALGTVAEEDVAVLLQLLDRPVVPEILARLTPDARQARTFTLLWHLLRQAAQPRPLVLAVENLHWIDPTSEAWLAFLIERLAGTAVLLLLTQRPGYQPPWGTHAAVTQLALPPLRAEDSEVVLQAVPGTAHLPAALRQQLIAHGAGNPFFIEELAWHAVEHGGALTPMAVPETVHAVLAARIDQLPPEAKTLLQTAAVIGPEVPVPLVQALAEFPEDALQQGLVHLQAAELFYETRLFPARAFTFKHALTHEVAYSSLLQVRRRALHARIVEVLEGLTRDQEGEVASAAKGLPAGRPDPDQVEHLAYHALRGEVWAKALAYCRQAGEKAIARSAYREAVEYFEQALSAHPHLPETRDTRAQAIDLRVALRSALLPSGDWDRSLAALREAETLAVALDDSHRLGQVLRFLAIHFYRMGAYDQTITAGQRALTLATANGDVVIYALMNQTLGVAYQFQGDYRRAIDCLRQAVASLDGARRHELFGSITLPAVSSRAWLARCHAELGAFAEGRSLGEEGLRIAEAVDHPHSLMRASWGIGLLSLRQGDLCRALPLLERAMGLCQGADLPGLFLEMAVALGAAYTLAGRVADTVPLLTQAIEQTITTEMVGTQALCSLSLGEAQMLVGRLEEAQALAEQALALTRAHQERGNEAYALHLLGEVAAHRTPPDVNLAVTPYRQALVLAEELGMRPLQAHCHYGLGRLYAKTGRREQSRAELSTALEMYRSMEMVFWLPQTEAALAQMEAR
jgi:class 3 adenylate cyclase/DNA-binding winged helix-turn-helix (wHTH) protein/tetratricopeptide (TPR) repeat protein